MKKKYYVNTAAQNNGDREVHHEHCIHLPPSGDRKYLGEFYSSMAAVVETIKTYPTAHACKICGNETI